MGIKDKDNEVRIKKNWTDKVAEEVNRKNDVSDNTEEFGGITVNVSPVIVVEGSQIQHSTISESIDNRAKENPSLTEVGTVASGLVGTVLGLLGKK